MRGLEGVEDSRAVAGRVAPFVGIAADELALEDALGVGNGSHGDDLVDDARELEAGLATVDLCLVGAPAIVVGALIEQADQPDVLALDVLQARERGDHLLPVQAVGPARVGLAGLFGESLRLALAPTEAQAAQDRDAVDKDGAVLCQGSGVAVLLADVGVVAVGVVNLLAGPGRVRTGQPADQVLGRVPVVHLDAVAGPAADGEAARFHVDEQGGRRVQGPEQARFPDFCCSEILTQN